MMKYDKHILELLELPGYIDYYIQMLPEYSHCKNTGEKAWEATERMFNRHFGKHKYNSYPTFKAALSRYYKEKKSRKITPK